MVRLHAGPARFVGRVLFGVRLANAVRFRAGHVGDGVSGLHFFFLLLLDGFQFGRDPDDGLLVGQISDKTGGDLTLFWIYSYRTL